MYKAFVLAAIIAVTPLSQHISNNNFTGSFNHSSFRFKFSNKNVVSPFENQKACTLDTAALKQSSWYAEAVKNIEASEYGIKKENKTNSFVAPNRQQQLKATFNYKSFTLQPNDEKSSWKLNLQLNGIYADHKLIAVPVEKDAPIVNANKVIFNNNDFSTEYINSKEGVRQNFILQNEPSFKPRNITIKLQTNKGWCVNKVHDKELHFAKLEKNHFSKKITYNSLKVWGADNKELDARFVVNEKQRNFEIEVNVENAVYPITVDPLSTTPAAILESNQVGAFMGRSVASAGDVNGDGYSDIIVGAPFYDNGQIDEGAAFIYHGSPTGISTTAAAMVESNQAGAEMGYLSSAGDVNGDGYSDVIVGAPAYDNGQTDEGAVFIYHGSPTGINTVAVAIIESNQADAQMSSSIACAGDINGDGYSDVIVGAASYDNGQTNEGAAFIYHGSPAGINTVAAAMVESNQADAAFGISVASAGDINGDGYSDVIVGAVNYDNGQTNEGVAFIYHGTSTGINTAAAAIVESNQADAAFGFSVASAGDINGDGYSDVIVGAFMYDNGENDEGVAFIYHGSATGINTTAAAMVESNQAGATMGSVAPAGDINGDGYSDVIVGAFKYSNGQLEEGVAFVYHGSSAGINTIAVAILESNQVGAQMAHTGPAGDVNGDGYSDVIVGAMYYDNGETDEGAAFVYHGGPNGLSATPNNTPDDADQAFANFGVSVSSAGDVNGDGYGDVIIGAWRYTDGGNSNEGVAFVYHGSATGLPATPNSILDDADQANVFFAETVACAGDVNGDGYSDVIIGADNYNDAGNSAEGRAFVYHGSPAGLSAFPNSILDDADQAFAFFGVSVAGAGDVNGDGYADVIVGAIGMTDGGNANEGLAYIYHGSSTGLSATPNSVPNDADQAGAWFGWSVASAGDVNGDGYSDVIIGALSYDEAPNTDEGRVFVYHGGPTGLSTTPNSTPDDANQAFAQFGECVATAGDVNGDGFSDVIIGAKLYDDGFTDEGRAFIYYGSSTGLSPSPGSTPDDADQATAHFGISVASAGDVNGDGYSDVIIGARYYDDGASSNEGRVFVYYGSSTGLSAAPNSTLDDADQANADFGYTVACAGDINGDGYSDVIVGAFLYDAGFSDEGQAFVYYGNNNTGLRNNLRLYNTDLTTPVNSSNFTLGNFGAGLFAKSFLGKTKGKMVWETRLNYNAYSGIPITNSTFFTAQQAGYSDLGLTGIELKNLIAKIGGSSKYTKLRARVKYNPVTAITGQVYGPWRNVSSIIDGNKLGALPINLISFNAAWLQKGKTAKLLFTTDKEVGTCCFDIEKSNDGFNFITIGTVIAKNSGGLQSYAFNDNTAVDKEQFYRLKIKGDNGQIEYSNIQHLQNNIATEILVFPNPTTDILQLQLNRVYDKMNVQIINSSGQTVKKMSGLIVLNQTIQIPVSDLASGNYWLRLQTGTEKQVLQFVKQ